MITLTFSGAKLEKLVLLLLFLGDGWVIVVLLHTALRCLPSAAQQLPFSSLILISITPHLAI